MHLRPKAHHYFIGRCGFCDKELKPTDPLWHGADPLRHDKTPSHNRNLSSVFHDGMPHLFHALLERLRPDDHEREREEQMLEALVKGLSEFRHLKAALRLSRA